MEDNATSSAAYVPGSDADAHGTYYFTAALLPPAAVVRRFGAASSGDDYKVSRCWIFRKGELVFTLHDWKSTNLYEDGLFSPEELWACEEPLYLYVGSKEPATQQDAAAFVRWLKEEVQRDF